MNVPNDKIDAELENRFCLTIYCTPFSAKKVEQRTSVMIKIAWDVMSQTSWYRDMIWLKKWYYKKEQSNFKTQIQYFISVGLNLNAQHE
jgi:hypothetical protein